MDNFVFILIPGWESSCKWFKYKYNNTDNLENINFLKNLKKIGKVYEHEINFFNLYYYYNEKTKKKNEISEALNKKYKIHEKKLNFNLTDLTFEGICKNIYNGVIEKFGNDKKYILVCHSFGCLIGLCFNEMYTKKCLFNIFIDNPPFYKSLKTKNYFSKHFMNYKKIYDEHLNTNKLLEKYLFEIKKSYKNANDKIEKILHIVHYFQIKYQYEKSSDKLLIYTIFFKANYTNDNDNFKKKWNEYNFKEKNYLKNNNNKLMYEYIECNDATHYIWENQKYSDNIINHIKNTIKLFL